MAEAVLAMRDVMSREEEESLVIRDPPCGKESTNCRGDLSIIPHRDVPLMC